jgi:hypothetical protein
MQFNLKNVLTLAYSFSNTLYITNRSHAQSQQNRQRCNMGWDNNTAYFSLPNNFKANTAFSSSANSADCTREGRGPYRWFAVVRGEDEQLQFYIITKPIREYSRLMWRLRGKKPASILCLYRSLLCALHKVRIL